MHRFIHLFAFSSSFQGCHGVLLAWSILTMLRCALTASVVIMMLQDDSAARVVPYRNRSKVLPQNAEQWTATVVMSVVLCCGDNCGTHCGAPVCFLRHAVEFSSQAPLMVLQP